MDDKMLQLAYATPVLAAVVQAKGCSDLDDCVDTTIQLITKLGEKFA